MPVDYSKIPQEMRVYHQWCVWRYEDRAAAKPTKIPYNPRTGRPASVSDSTTWCQYHEALAAMGEGTSYSGIGFMLTKNDPFTFIDLDDTDGNHQNYERQLKIYSEFNSYSERSPSGKGCHIIVKGQVPNGRRRGAVEIYSDSRYMTMTGDVCNDKPISERQALVQILWAQMGKDAGVSIYTGDAKEFYTDEQVLNKALSAVNMEKFKALHEGDYKLYYPSQSEADFAYVDILAFYSMNFAQIKRMFLSSVLGQRDKAQRTDYVDKMILRAFDRMLPPIDMDGLQNAVEDNKEILKACAETIIPGVTEVAEETSALAEIRKFHTPTSPTPPPGLVGEIARFIYDSAPRPVPEIALAAAIGFMAGICGRAYNISGTGLNLYVLLLAQTGTGKEAMAGGINKLINAVAAKVPSIVDFRGPAEIASGQALLTQISKANKKCFFSIVGEFGIKMQQLASPRASSSELMLKRVLLDLYNKSGKNDIVAPSVYAEKDKDTQTVKSPAVTIIGESTPETFYKSLDEGLITDGLLPRFLFIEYTGDRPDLNEGHEFIQPSLNLVSRLADLVVSVLQKHQSDEVMVVECTPEAVEFLRLVNKKVDAAMRATRTDVLRHLWNRAHMKTMKLAAVCAVGENYLRPVMTLENAKWAYNIVVADILSIVTRFSNGEIGKNTEENKQGKTILQTCADYLSADWKDIASYATGKNLHDARIIPYSYIMRRLNSKEIFAKAPLGARETFKRTVQALIDTGELTEMDKREMIKLYGYKGRSFMLSDPAKLPAAMK